MRLLIDEQISSAVARGLRAHGFDAVSAEEAGLRSQPDSEIWRFAAAERRAVVTYNRDDFLALAADSFHAGVPHAGLIIVSSRTIRPSVFGLVEALESLSTNNVAVANQVLFLTRA